MKKPVVPIAYHQCVTHDVITHAGLFPDLHQNRISLLKRNSMFQGATREATLMGQVKVTLEDVECGFAEQVCHVASDKVLIMRLVPKIRTLLNAREVCPAKLYICSGKFLHALGTGESQISMVTIDRSLLAHLNTPIQALLGTAAPFEMTISPCPDATREFADQLNACLAAAARAPDASQAADILLRVIRSTTDVLSEDRAYAAGNVSPTRAYIVREACQLLHAHLFNCDLSIDDICTRLKVSRRTLQYSFQAVIGMAPLNYIRLIRLNAARKLILDAPREEIQGIASEAGFNHLGRFSGYYKDFYGELPSMTGILAG